MVVDHRIDDAIYGVLDALSNCLLKFPAGPITDFLQGALLMVRRTFFDQAPTLKPVQETGQVSGDITGNLNGFDPEGDPIAYSIVQAPKTGTLTLKPNGAYIYIPGLGFDGSDAFVVAATDKAATVNTLAPNATATPSTGLSGNAATALTGNWIDPKRPTSTGAFVSLTRVTTNQITFNFTPVDESAEVTWEDEPIALPALQWAAFELGKSFVTEKPVTLNYRYDYSYKGLAAMNTPDSARKEANFDLTKAQAKIAFNYTDPSSTPDGTISLNFDPTYTINKVTRDAQWEYFGQLGRTEYDFISVVTHELLHSFGFTDNVNAPGCNVHTCEDGKSTGKLKVRWNYYDSFLGNAKGQKALTKDEDGDPLWNKTFDGNLIANGKKYNYEDGLHFVGTKAQAAFNNKPVPLFSPATYDPGSSVSHLSDYYFDNEDLTKPNGIKLMNAQDTAGVKVPWTLSNIEIGILEDLGYMMNTPAPAPAPAAVAPSPL